MRKPIVAQMTPISRSRKGSASSKTRSSDAVSIDGVRKRFVEQRTNVMGFAFCSSQPHRIAWRKIMLMTLPLCANISETSSPSTITVGRGKKSHFDEHKQDKQFFRCVGSFGA
jgi:hypothetical protein